MVKWPQPSERTTTRIEGRTSDEAVRLARMEFGVDAPVRCWKARRGGLFGFFAKEVFVAGIEAPDGLDDVSTTSASTPALATWGMRRDLQRDVAPIPATSLDDDDWLMSTDGDALSDLIESTHDELTLGTVPGLESAFHDVLAQAQAALDSERRQLSDPPHFASPASSPEEEPAAALTPAPAPAPAVATAPLGDLATLVADLGIPRDYWPEGHEYSLDGLLASLSKLPVAPRVPRELGSVVVVLGAKRDAQTVALRLVELLDLDAGDVIEAECTSASRQRINRRRATRVTIVTVESSLRSRTLAQATTWIEQIEPDYVVGAVSATNKTADVLTWRRQLPRMDALALSRVGETSTPGELLGDLPVLLVDGAPASALHWVALVLRTYLERQ
jgi:hypothetical protein